MAGAGPQGWRGAAVPKRRPPRTSHLQVRIKLQAIAHRRLSWVELIARALRLAGSTRARVQACWAPSCPSVSAPCRRRVAGPFHPRQQLRPPARLGGLDDPADRLRGRRSFWWPRRGATDCRHGQAFSFERRRLAIATVSVGGGPQPASRQAPLRPGRTQPAQPDPHAAASLAGAFRHGAHRRKPPPAPAVAGNRAQILSVTSWPKMLPSAAQAGGRAPAMK